MIRDASDLHQIPEESSFDADSGSFTSGGNEGKPWSQSNDTFDELARTAEAFSSGLIRDKSVYIKFIPKQKYNFSQVTSKSHTGDSEISLASDPKHRHV